MKCPKCQNDQRRKEGSRCLSCGYSFIFPDPKYDYKLSDNKLGHLLRKVSANETRYFTTASVQTAIGLRPKSKGGHIALTLFMLVWATGFCGGIISALTNHSFGFYIMPFVVIGVSVYLYRKGNKWPPKAKVHEWLRKWDKYVKPLDYWIQEPSLEINSTKSYEEKDIEAYGIEKVLIVDEDIMVDFLVKNNWHTDNQTLVLSETGYPKAAYDYFQKYQKDNPNINVFLYHSSEHDSFEAYLRDKGFLDSGLKQVQDLGLTKSMVENSKYFKKKFKNSPGENIGIDQMPIHASLGVLTATVVGGALLEDMMVDQSRVSFEATLMSDFG